MTATMPTWEQLKDRLGELGAERGEWAGVPLILDSHRLVIEPRYPFAGLQGATLAEETPVEIPDYKVRNMWVSRRLRLTVVIMEEADGRITKCFLADGHARRARFALETLGVAASPAWSIEAENNALAKLESLIGERRFKTYFLSGAFTETSKRSGVTYMFRRLRPTLAIRSHQTGSRVLAALCLHPIGYYEDTWAGVMVPTDCVLAHLLLMRGDERKFWAHANQHSPDSGEAGI